MGALPGLLGVGGGAGGSGFGGPQQSNQRGDINMQQAYEMLRQTASGQGPNPAMAQYNQNVQNLARQQAGAISSVQGISPALATRMISQQGGGALQNAAAQGATAQAEQQLGAMGAMGQIGNAQQVAANQMMGNINTNNAGLAQTTMQGQQGLVGGLMNAAGAAFGLAAGGEIPKVRPMADGGVVGPQSDFGRFFQNVNVSGMGADLGGIHAGANFGAQSMANAGKGKKSPGQPRSIDATQGMDTVMAGGAGDVGGMTTPLEMAAAYGGNVGSKLKAGGKVPGTPKVPGNSYANDVVSAKLSPGEVVIPNSVMQSEDPVANGAKFIQGIIAKHRARR